MLLLIHGGLVVIHVNHNILEEHNTQPSKRKRYQRMQLTQNNKQSIAWQRIA
jgi:hypothetical protein